MNFESNISIRFLNKKGLNHQKYFYLLKCVLIIFDWVPLLRRPQRPESIIYITMALEIKRIV